ncbi:MAG: phosphoribosyl-AMP cyclohydrolase [Denitrovibrio sp.]|nr:MAG: phosphoribosyl-AMP cyclohydrolase [Denitrovibrio sp.]
MIKIDWDKQNGLLPAIAQDAETKDVLMLAYVNKEALKLTFETGYAHYFSRSRDQIWKKGETSGHLQKIRDVFLDCDGDTVLYIIDQTGAACHTGERTCFFTKLSSAGDKII